MNVLVADDDGLVAHQTGRVLRRLGHTVVGTAETGRAAVAMAEQLRPELAVLDIMMPEMDGVEAARRILIALDIPIVLITGFASPTLPKRAEAAGVFTLVAKPASEGKLASAIAAALLRFQARRAE